MCGIAGWFDMADDRPPDRPLVQAMTDAIRHRGPDGEGFHFAPGLGLGHRRLAIIDLAGGKQPMSNETATVVVTFNGEIYNFKELRRELEELGHHFRTNSDTEVIIHGWSEWGSDCVTRFVGMFAFALWDTGRRLLFLARDRFGEKPLYYALQSGGTLIFGSELKALLVDPRLPRNIDPAAIEEFFALGYIAEPRTIYQGMMRLPAGHTLTIRRGTDPVLHRYWDPVPERHAGMDVDATGAHLVALLGSAVRAQLVSDVPLGAFLSGGADSSAVVALASKASTEPLTCLSIGFREKQYDESAYAERVAAQYGARQIVETVDGQEIGPMDRLAGIFDEPFGDSSALPSYHLMRLARRHVTVAISGDGGDELLAGYRRYRFHAHEERWRALLPDGIRRPVFGALARLYPRMDWAPRYLRARHTLRELSLDTTGGYFWNVSVTDDETRRRLFTAGLMRDLQGYHAADVLRCHIDAAPSDDPVTIAQYVDLKTWLPSDILTKVDRTSMACSVEARVPMLDPAFAQFALGIPATQKIRDGHGKFAFKRALEPYLPDEVLYRPKQGFSIPLASWLHGSLGMRFRSDILCSLDGAGSAYLCREHVLRLLDQHRSGTHDHSRVLWLVWVFGQFLTKVHASTVDLRAVA